MNPAPRNSGAAPATLRPIAVRDLPAILEIERESFADPWSEASFRSMLQNPQVLAAVAEQGGRVRGYFVAWMVADEAELANLAVDSEVRRSGLGRALLDHLLAEVASRGGATIYLEVRASNTAAHALYRGRGFREAGRRTGYYQSPTEDAVLMRRARPAPNDERTD